MSEQGQETGAGSSGAGVEPAAAALPSPGDRVSALWRQLKEHRIAQWAIGYVALIFAIQHAVTLTTEAFEWPHLVIRISMLLLILGLPIVMALAWYHGEHINRRISGAELTIISLLLVGIAIPFYLFVRPTEQTVAEREAVAPYVAPATPQGPSNGISVAVLPFLNLSGDPKQEFFSDGMTEEITSALAKVKGMTVVARTSAFQFKGENKDIRAVGQALGANRLIEGSVRMAGDRVRITAQLIRADTGAHLWTENYDRELKDVFAVQEDIAQAIAGALQVPLGLNEGEHLVSNRTNNTSSYQDYLRARAIFRTRDLAQAISLLEKAVASDPSYAPSWALLAQSYNLAPVYMLSLYDGPIEQISARYRSFADKSERAAQQALRLDSRSAAGHAALAQSAAFRLDWVTADEQFRQALTYDPDDPDVLNIYAYNLLGAAGYLKEALHRMEHLHRLEPLVPIYNIVRARILAANGQYKTAIGILQDGPAGGPTGYLRNKFLAVALADAGRYGEAADTLLAIPPTPVESRTAVENAAKFLRFAPKNASSLNSLPAFGDLSFVYVLIGASSRYFENPERTIAIDGSVKNALVDLWNPALAPLRKTEQFKELMRKAKLVDYWRTHGWPDLCHPVGANDFECN